MGQRPRDFAGWDAKKVIQHRGSANVHMRTSDRVRVPGRLVNRRWSPPQSNVNEEDQSLEDIGSILPPIIF